MFTLIFMNFLIPIQQQQSKASYGTMNFVSAKNTLSEWVRMRKWDHASSSQTKSAEKRAKMLHSMLPAGAHPHAQVDCSGVLIWCPLRKSNDFLHKLNFMLIVISLVVTCAQLWKYPLFLGQYFLDDWIPTTMAMGVF